jgi:chromosome segregation ATPase
VSLAQCPQWQGCAQLRADLATAKQDLANEQASHDRTSKMLSERLTTVTAERDAFDLERREKGDALLFHIKAYDLERAAHAETRKSLEDRERALSFEQASHDRTDKMLNERLESTRAELAKAEARVKEAIAELMPNENRSPPTRIIRALGVLRG